MRCIHRIQDGIKNNVRDLPNVFQGFSSPSKNGRENKIYSNSKTMFSLQHVNQLAKNVNKCYTM